MRLIDADALKDSFCEACSTKKRYKRTDAECRTHSNALYGYSCFKMRLIDNAPTIDAKPVTYCNMCKHYETDTGYCQYHDHGMHWDDFCSRAAKMDLEVQDGKSV